MSSVTQDNNTKRSTHTPQVAGKTVVPKATGSGNSLEVRGDFGVWDTTANKFVLVDQTNFGTTTIPKNQ